MEISTWGAISTVLVTIAFLGVSLWAFSSKLKDRFDEDANLPFADDMPEKKKDKQMDDQDHQEERKKL